MTADTISKVAEKINPYIHRTPVMSSEAIDTIAGANIKFKCENFQKMGAFKMRGAINAILSLSDEQRNKGVVTHSSGNFAQAVSLAAKSLGIKAHIVMPKNAPKVKVAAVNGYGGNITMVESTIEARQQAADEIAEREGATLLHPSNDMEVILGNSTSAFELLQDHPDLDYLLAPIGGGGLIAGTALSAFHFGENCEAIGAEPKNVDDAYRSLKAGEILKNDSIDTIADGLRTHLGDINFPIIQKYVKEIIRVEENEIIAAMRLIWERMKIICEPSCAVPLAAVLKEKQQFSNAKIGIILSGGNVDVEKLPF